MRGNPMRPILSQHKTKGCFNIHHFTKGCCCAINIWYIFLTCSFCSPFSECGRSGTVISLSRSIQFRLHTKQHSIGILFSKITFSTSWGINTPWPRCKGESIDGIHVRVVTGERLENANGWPLHFHGCNMNAIRRRWGVGDDSLEREAARPHWEHIGSHDGVRIQHQADVVFRF